MTDITPVEKKNLLNALHSLVQEGAHLFLVPAVAVLKAIITGLTYVHDELAKY